MFFSGWIRMRKWNCFSISSVCVAGTTVSCFICVGAIIRRWSFEIVRMFVRILGIYFLRLLICDFDAERYEEVFKVTLFKLSSVSCLDWFTLKVGIPFQLFWIWPIFLFDENLSYETIRQTAKKIKKWISSMLTLIFHL